jgi:regulator of nonsense transcripts 2
LLLDDADELALAAAGGKWEDEEERRFFEDIQDLREVVPRGFLGVEDDAADAVNKDAESAEDRQKAEAEEVRKLEEELAGLSADGAQPSALPLPLSNGHAAQADEDEDDGCVRLFAAKIRLGLTVPFL